MSTLTVTHTPYAADETAAISPRRSWWQRFYAAVLRSRQRRAEREITAYLSRHGGPLTDDLEREIMRRLTH
ncbi:MAG TPA: hypothetical protein VKF35_15690 [Hyphomicrobiaceae bacterium]|nr:hypothetical protein [Hyphomicrobiaceae bacterium]